MKLLVTGGAGYIGSHVVAQLLEAGHEITVVDNLSTGSKTAVGSAELISLDLKDVEKLDKVFAQKKIDAVLHFAASIIVPESIKKPLFYYSNNTSNTLNLLKCCSNHNVQKLIFSSTAAVYGEPNSLPVDEASTVSPINPYGSSKLMSEMMIRDYGSVSNLSYVILRYFNVAGASLDSSLGQYREDATHLIKMVCEAALAKRPSVSVFGKDFPTRDGTGVRDYIHVEDLAAAHVAALNYLNENKESTTLNCGYGHGYSVLEIINCAKDITGIDFDVEFIERRKGDPAEVISANSKIKDTLTWNPRYDNLRLTVGTSLLWEINREISKQVTFERSVEHLELLKETVQKNMYQ